MVQATATVPTAISQNLVPHFWDIYCHNRIGAPPDSLPTPAMPGGNFATPPLAYPPQSRSTRLSAWKALADSDNLMIDHGGGGGCSGVGGWLVVFHHQHGDGARCQRLVAVWQVAAKVT